MRARQEVEALRQQQQQQLAAAAASPQQLAPQADGSGAREQQLASELEAAQRQLAAQQAQQARLECELGGKAAALAAADKKLRQLESITRRLLAGSHKAVGSASEPTGGGGDAWRIGTRA